MDTDNDRPTLARVYRSLRDICPDSWNLPGGRMPTGLGYDFLRPVEDSGINDLKHYYFMADLADGQPLGRANLYSVCFDLATTDRKLTPAWRTTIKRWFPGFMTFRFLECGLLTMVSNPLALRSDTDLERVLPVLAGQMDQLAHDDGSDFLMIRDVDPEHYQRYLDILRPLGFRPALGFSRVDTTISWSSVEEALGCLSHKRRLPLKTSLEFRERFGIEVEGRLHQRSGLVPRNRQAGPTWERNSMTDDADLDLVRRTFAAFARGDLAELTQCFAPDVEQFVPGKHALAGVFRGVDNVVACLGDTAAAADGTMTVTLEDVLSNTDGQVIAVYRLRASRAGKVLDQREAILVTVAGGRITRLSEFYADPAATESFWA